MTPKWLCAHKWNGPRLAPWQPLGTGRMHAHAEAWCYRCNGGPIEWRELTLDEWNQPAIRAAEEASMLDVVEERMKRESRQWWRIL